MEKYYCFFLFSEHRVYMCVSRHAQDVRELYERKLERANNLYMELCACMLQMEKRERELAKWGSVAHIHSFTRVFIDSHSLIHTCSQWFTFTYSHVYSLIHIHSFTRVFSDSHSLIHTCIHWFTFTHSHVYSLIHIHSFTRVVSDSHSLIHTCSQWFTFTHSHV